MHVHHSNQSVLCARGSAPENWAGGRQVPSAHDEVGLPRLHGVEPTAPPPWAPPPSRELAFLL